MKYTITKNAEFGSLEVRFDEKREARGHCATCSEAPENALARGQ